MIKFVRKINWGLVVLGSLLFAAANSPFSFAEEKLSAEKAYVNDVYKNMMDVKSLQYSIVLKAETPMGNVEAVIDGEGREKPLLLRQDINISFHDQNIDKTIMQKQYIEETQENLVMYLSNNDSWLKQTVPLDHSLYKNLSEDEKAAARMKLLQMMKAVKLKQETPTYKYIEITLDAGLLSDAIEEAVKQNNVQSKDVLRFVALGRLAMLAAGDIKYTIKVDKTTKMVQDLDLDLTQPIRKGAGVFLDLVMPKDRALMEDFLTKSTLNIELTYLKYNQSDAVEIPQDVRDSAKEVKLPEKAALPKE